MKKKILALCLVLVLGATAIIGGTLAYFSDTDSATNVMVSGNLDIIQKEQQRTIGDEVEVGDGDTVYTGDGIETFEDNKELFPVSAEAVDKAGFETVVVNGHEVNLRKHELVLDKIVSVKNNGSEQAYVRTLFVREMAPMYFYTDNTYSYFEKDPDKTVLTEGMTDAPVLTCWEEDVNALLDENGNRITIKTKAGKVYSVSVCYYPDTTDNGILAAGEYTGPSMTQLYLDGAAGNDFTKWCNGEYKIYALSQAAQVEGFDSAAEAFEACFGEDSAENVVKWFAGLVDLTLPNT